jgi:hypothetical protein
MSAPEGRLCSNCNQIKPDSYFSGRTNQCKDCINAARRARRLKNGDEIRKKRRDYVKKNREHINARRDNWLSEREGIKAQYQKRWYEKHPEAAKYARELQRISLENASRFGFEWAGWELEVVADRSRSLKEVAQLVGRTYYTVSTMRHLIESDPKTILRAGLPEGDQQ